MGGEEKEVDNVIENVEPSLNAGDDNNNLEQVKNTEIDSVIPEDNVENGEKDNTGEVALVEDQKTEENNVKKSKRGGASKKGKKSKKTEDAEDVEEPSDEKPDEKPDKKVGKKSKKSKKGDGVDKEKQPEETKVENADQTELATEENKDDKKEDDEQPPEKEKPSDEKRAKKGGKKPKKSKKEETEKIKVGIEDQTEPVAEEKTEDLEEKKSKTTKKGKEKKIAPQGEPAELAEGAEEPTPEVDEETKTAKKGKKGSKGKKSKKSNVKTTASDDEDKMESLKESTVKLVNGDDNEQEEKITSDMSKSRTDKQTEGKNKKKKSSGKSKTTMPKSHSTGSVRSKSPFSAHGHASKTTLMSSYSGSSSISHEEEHQVHVMIDLQKKGKKGKMGKGKKVISREKLDEGKAETGAEGEPVKEKEEHTPKGKKGKKDKKKGKKEGTEAEAATDVEDDVLAEINKLKAQAGGDIKTEAEEASAEGESKKGKKKKGKKKKDELGSAVTEKGKGPKKKLSKKERQKLNAELAEKARIEAEKEAIIQAELERIRQLEEKKALIEKDKREVVEEQWRIEQLTKSQLFLGKLINYNLNLAREEKEESEWQLYVNCGYLPDPSQCDVMNTYLHLWEKDIENTTIEAASKRTADVIKLLNDLEELIDTVTEEDMDKLDNWKWVRVLFREYQRKSLDIATYRLLRNIEKNLNRIDIPTADFHFKDDHMILGLWLRVNLPVPLPNPRRPPKPRIDVDFADMNLNILFPLSIGGDNMAVRVMYLKYDHLSDLSASYDIPHVPDIYNMDLLTCIKKEWRSKLKYKYDKRIRLPPPAPEDADAQEEGVAKEEAELPPPVVEQEDFASDEEIPIVPFQKLEPTASEMAIAQEDALYAESRNLMMLTVEDNVINLRKFTILGGVYLINLIQQPPQPQDFITMYMNITPLYLPKQLEEVPFYAEYVPPAPPEAGVRRLPEEIEEELKKQEEELEQLILITLSWPQHVMFLELPLVCHWDEERKLWTKKDVHDLKHNEEKGTLSFRTGRFGAMALATFRYANLPYQAWELKPEADGSVTLQLTAAILMLEFNIKNGLVCISQLQNSPNNALQDQVGVYCKFHKIARMMKSSGVDIFPAFDALCYVEGSCEKHYPTEKQVYYNMACLSTCFNFAWSRWNVTAGRRNIVMQMREYRTDRPKQKNYSMVLVTPQKATFIDCTEVSQTFSTEDLEANKFCSDLYNLMAATNRISLRNKVENASKELVFVLSEILIATRMLSFS